MAIAAAACTSAEPPRRYELTGQVLAINPERQELTVKHNDIPNFMPAMTMNYPVASKALLDGRVPGELIAATLEVQDATGRLTEIRRTGTAPLPSESEVAMAAGVLAEGDEVPDVALVDQTDQRRSFSEWRGHLTLVTFIYTSCPLPTYCPLMDQNFATLQRAVAEDGRLKGQVRLVSITFDPETRYAEGAGGARGTPQGRSGGVDLSDRRSGHGPSIRRPLRRRRDPAGRGDGDQPQPPHGARRPRRPNSQVLLGERVDAQHRTRGPAIGGCGALMTPRIPDLTFSKAERHVIRRHRSPLAVQGFLNRLPYNTEPPPDPATLRSFRGVIGHRTANCIESAITAAVILEQHGFPPLVMSLESIDGLDHVLFIYKERGRWGSVARSRDPGLHGRKPVFATLRALASSYVEPYVDRTGAVKAYGAVDLGVLGRYDWRLASTNVWKVERLLFEIPHRPDSHVARTASPPPEALCRVPRVARRPKARVLRPQEMDTDSRDV